MSHALLLSALLSASIPADPPLPTVEEVTRYIDDLYRADSSHGELSMEIKTKHFERTLEIESWSKGKDLSVAVIRKPARESGTATLRTKDGMWNYAPRADRLMRVPTALLSEGWMGSHFTNDDLMRESSWEDDYASTVRWGSDAGGKRVLELVSIPRPDAAVVYSRVVFVCDPKTYMPRRTDYYDKDEIVRTFFYESPRDFGGRTIPAVLRIVPTDKPEERTVVTYRSMQFNPTVDDSLFTARGLRQAARK